MGCQSSPSTIPFGPGGIDKFFTEVGEPAERHELPPPSDTPPDLDYIASVAAKYGMHITVPADA